MQNVHIPPLFYVAEQTILPLPFLDSEKNVKSFIWQLLNTTSKDSAYLSDDRHASVVRQPGHKPFAFGRIRFRP